jgi:hypothetical protein
LVLFDVCLRYNADGKVFEIYWDCKNVFLVLARYSLDISDVVGFSKVTESMSQGFWGKVA